MIATSFALLLAVIAASLAFAVGIKLGTLNSVFHASDADLIVELRKRREAKLIKERAIREIEEEMKP